MHSLRNALLSLAVASAAAFAQSTPSLDSLYLKNPAYRHLTGLWAVSALRHADIIMLGNSLTQGVAWNELLGRPSIANRGIGGDNLPGFLHRLSSVVDLTPKVCFVMGGINDIYAGFPLDAIEKNYAALLDSLRAHGIVPVVQSTLPVSQRWHDADLKNPVVASLDDWLADHCRREGIEFLDLRPVLAAEGRLREEFTTDGVHLTPAGYAAWGSALEPCLRRHGL